MKKILFVFLLAAVLFNVPVNSAPPDITHRLREGEVYLGGRVWSDIIGIRFTGSGYIIETDDGSGNFNSVFTSDFVDFKQVSVFDDSESLGRYSRAGRMDEIKAADDGYIARSDVYDNYGKSDHVLEENGCLYFLNDDFGLKKKVGFSDYVREMAYVDGVYYVKTSNRAYLNANAPMASSDDIEEKVYSSADAENWSERPELEHVPYDNGKSVITLRGENIYLFENGGPGSRVSYEKMRLIDSGGPYSDTASQQVLNLFGEYFCVANNDEKNVYGDVWMSKDGVYFAEFNMGALEFIPGTDALCDKHESAYVLKSDIDKFLPEDPLFVRLDGVTLGFEKPPVILDGTVYAPLDFLIKSMGGEVGAAENGEIVINLPLDAEQRMFGFKSGGISVTLPTSKRFAAPLPIKKVDGVIYAPLRCVAESLGYRYAPPDSGKVIKITRR